MNRNFLLLLFVSLFFGLSSGVGVSAQAVKKASPSANLVADNFESYEVGSAFPTAPWTNHNSSATWSIATDGSKVARQSGAVSNLISIGNTAWTDYTVSARIKTHALAYRSGIFGRFTSTSAYYSLYIRTSAGGTKVIELNKREGSANVVLGNVTVPAIVIGEFYKLTLSMQGSSIKGYLNDELKLDFTDTAYTAGKPGLYNTGDTTYDDFTVDDFSTAPGVPSGLSATATSGQIGLSWTAGGGATGYNVKRSETDGGPYTTVGTSTSLTYADTAITTGTTYYYVVTATNAAGESTISNQASATAILAAPPVPSSLQTAAGNQEAKVFWTGSPLADSYNVKRSLASSGTYETIATGVTTPSYHDTGLTNGTSYYYRISAVNGGGESANSGSAVATPRLGQAVSVTNQTQFQTAMNNAVAGDVITLADGNYSAFKIRRKYGTAEQPIVVRAANHLGAIFNAGQLELENTHHVTYEGFKFTNSAGIKFRNTSYNRLTRSSIEMNETGLTDLDWLSIAGTGSHHNRIDHNEFKNKVALGNFVQIGGDNGQSSQYDVIDHNYFFNLGPRDINDKEAIRIGDSGVSQSSGFTVIEHNLFEQCDGDPEVVSLKTNDNIVRYNTFRRSQGGLTARQGNRSLMYGNFFLGEGAEGTGGIRAYGDDHKIFNNYFEGLTGTAATAPIAITNGDADDAHLPGADQSKHYRPRRIVIVNNTLVGNVSNIEIGGNYNLPPRDLVFANNLIVAATGNVVKYRTDPINPTYSGNIGFTTGSATIGIPATEAEIRNIDPVLTVVNGVSKLGENSPAINASTGSYPFVIEDLEGQTRSGINDVGADEFGAFDPQRAPRTAATAGIATTDRSISGRVVDEEGTPVAGVVVRVNGSVAGNPVGTRTSDTVTDAAGYFVSTDFVQGGEYSVSFEKAGLQFSPATIPFPTLTSDAFVTTTASEAPSVPFANISGTVMAEGRPISRAIVTLSASGRPSLVVVTNTFGRFIFPDQPTGVSYTITVVERRNTFAQQNIQLNGPMTGLTITPVVNTVGSGIGQ